MNTYIILHLSVSQHTVKTDNAFTFNFRFEKLLKFYYNKVDTNSRYYHSAPNIQTGKALAKYFFKYSEEGGQNYEIIYLKIVMPYTTVFFIKFMQFWTSLQCVFQCSYVRNFTIVAVLVD